MIDSLDVILWGRKVGTLVSVPKGYRHQACFYFDPAFVGGRIDISPIRCPLSSVAAQKGLPVYPEEAREFGGLPSFIADSLPDHWGNVLFAEWARSNHIRSRDISPLDRLAYIGRRGMGALEFVPPLSAEMETAFRVEVSELAALAQKALEGAKRFHAVFSPGSIMESLFKVGTSAGGRRPKAVINMNPVSGECYSGQLPGPTPEFIPMIIKFDEHTAIPTTRIEYSYYLMAAEAGLCMKPSRLIEGGHEAHFLTERFDRKGDEKIHVQTLAAMNPFSSSYEDLFEAAVRLSIVPEEIKRLFLQMAMNVVCGNVDDHNKNFSFIMGRDGVWHISPAYDFTFAVDTSGPSYINRHCMAVNGNTDGISCLDMLEIAARYDIKGASALLQRVVDIASGYRQYGVEARVPENWIVIIEREIASRIAALQH